MLPDHTYSLDAIGEGHFNIVEKENSTFVYQYDDLLASGVIDKARATSSNIQAPDILDALGRKSSEDSRVTLWGAWIEQVEQVGIAMPLDNGSFRWVAPMLCRHDFFRRESRKTAIALAQAIVQAWGFLRQYSDALNMTIETMLNHSAYSRAARRCMQIDSVLELSNGKQLDISPFGSQPVVSFDYGAGAASVLDKTVGKIPARQRIVLEVLLECFPNSVSKDQLRDKVDDQIRVLKRSKAVEKGFDVADPTGCIRELRKKFGSNVIPEEGRGKGYRLISRTEYLRLGEGRE